MWSGVGALGAAVGPGPGGILIELATWRAALLVNLPFGALIVWFAWRRLPMLGGAARGEGLDLIGIGLIIAGAQIIVHEGDEPNAVVDFGDSQFLTAGQ